MKFTVQCPKDSLKNPKWARIVTYMKTLDSLNGDYPMDYYRVDENRVIFIVKDDLDFNPEFPILTMDEVLYLLDTKHVSISQDFLKEAYERADSKTKLLIKKNVDAFDLTTTKDFVLQMVDKYKNCPEWTEKLKREFPQILIEIDLSTGKFDGKNVFSLNMGENNLIEPATDKPDSLWLNPGYNWKLNENILTISKRK